MRHVLPFLSLLLASCSPGGSLLGDESSNTLGWNLSLQWEECTLLTGGGGGPAQCAEVGVPLDWENRTGEQITLFVKRATSSGVPVEDTDVAVWLLSGEPGAAGNTQESFAELFLSNDDNLVFYLLDHRGTGRSTRLGCDAEGSDTPGGRRIVPDEFTDCGDEVRERWGPDVAGFTTTQAATDLAVLVETTTIQNQSVHLHGNSYATRWLQRALQLNPTLADSASGLGVVPPNFSFADHDAAFETVGAEFLNLCVEDAVCVSRLGPSPIGTVRSALADLQFGNCPFTSDVELTRDRLRTFFGGVLVTGGDNRVAIPAISHRLDRCNADDRTALRYFAENVVDPLDELRDDPMYSSVLGNIIILNELWEGGPGVDEALDQHRAGLFSLGSTVLAAQLEEANWPSAPRPFLADEVLDVDVPMLWINGELDPVTPLAPVLAMLDDTPSRPDEYLLAIPGGGHGWTSPTVKGYDCAMTTWWNFAREPTDEIFACDFQIVPPNLGGSTEAAQWLFGRDDLWGSYQGD